MGRFLIIAMLLAASAASGQTISAVNDTVSNGASITISGSGFGAKSPAAPILWDNFEYGSDGDGLGSFENWTSYNGPGGYISDDQAYSGTRAAHSQYPPDNGFNTSYHVWTNPADTVYYTYRSRKITTGDTYGQYKNGRINASPNHYNGAGNTSISDNYAVYWPASSLLNLGWISYTETDGWNRQEIFKISSTPGVADGALWFSVTDSAGNISTRSDWAVMTRASGETWENDNIMLGLMYANGRNDGVHRMYVDDVYVDRTRARVELGNASVWGACTNKEIQIPSAWSATSITITVNTGAFQDEDTAWLYVIDSSGNVSAGYAVTIGDAGGGYIPPTSSYAITSMSRSGNLATVGWGEPDPAPSHYQVLCYENDVLRRAAAQVDSLTRSITMPIDSIKTNRFRVQAIGSDGSVQSTTADTVLSGS